jgi:hypothetical protein
VQPKSGGTNGLQNAKKSTLENHHQSSTFFPGEHHKSRKSWDIVLVFPFQEKKESDKVIPGKFTFEKFRTAIVGNPLGDGSDRIYKTMRCALGPDAVNSGAHSELMRHRKSTQSGRLSQAVLGAGVELGTMMAQLESLPQFKDMTPAQSGLLVKKFLPVSFQDHEELISENDVLNEDSLFYFITAGSVTVYTTNKEGVEEPSTKSEGDYFNEACLKARSSKKAGLKVVAGEEGVSCLTISASTFRYVKKTANQSDRSLILTDQMDKVLLHEWKKTVGAEKDGSPSDATQSEYYEMVVKSVAQRLQLACGLETWMFKSLDADEVIMCAQSDPADLIDEAERTGYQLQMRHQPFSKQMHKQDEDWINIQSSDHKNIYEKSKLHMAEVHGAADDTNKDMFRAARDYLKADKDGQRVKEFEDYNRATTGNPSVELDPRILRTNLYPEMQQALANWGHNIDVDTRGNEERNSMFGMRELINGDWITKPNKFCLLSPRAWLHNVFVLAPHRDTYFAPYQKLKITGSAAKCFPYYRKYAFDEEGNSASTSASLRAVTFVDESTNKPAGTVVGHSLFRDIDRLRLTDSIIARHINLDNLEFKKMLKCHFHAHNHRELNRLKRDWALNFDIRELWGSRTQPLLEIRDYYGEKVGLYFAWLELYTKFLVLPMGFGVFIYMINFVEQKSSNYSLVVFGVVISLWSTIFQETWKRKNSVLNLWWGTTDFRKEERHRPAFKGTLGLDEVTDEKITDFTQYDRFVRGLTVGSVVVAVLVLVAVGAVAAVFYIKYYMIVTLEWQYGAIYAGLINAVQLITLNEIYQMVAVMLCDWENHRTDSSYENTLVVKTFAFQFVNSYFSFFYIAFIKQYIESVSMGSHAGPKGAVLDCPESYNPSLTALSYNLTASNGESYARCSKPCFEAGLHATGFMQTVDGELISKGGSLEGIDWTLSDAQKRYWSHVELDQQCGGCIPNAGLLGAATGVPDCMYELRVQLISVFVSAILVSNFMEVVFPLLEAKTNMLKEWYFLTAEQKAKLKKGDYENVELEAKWKEYDEIESFKDYSEMVIQYGFVTLFVVAFPLTPLLAFLNNVLEAHVDAVKLTSVRRPKPKKAENIGIWEYFIAMLSTTSALTNCAIVLFTSTDIFRREEFSMTRKLLYFIIFQNSIMVVKRIVEDAVPDMLPKVEEFNLRFKRIADAAMTGRVEVPAEKEEDMEDLNLTIEENPTMRRYASSLSSDDGSVDISLDARDRSYTNNPMGQEMGQGSGSIQQTKMDKTFLDSDSSRDIDDAREVRMIPTKVTDPNSLVRGVTSTAEI